ncbi:hypothetical protein ACRQ5Q_24360 [Bradyrhizobium sp. PMVTL-01]|uniref:hypothetical protein n=1 Tax=Bradyrhizobium sp. PMVTL-01 TaxID=3434999 RepID=UPI003F6F46DE
MVPLSRINGLAPFRPAEEINHFLRIGTKIDDVCFDVIQRRTLTTATTAKGLLTMSSTRPSFAHAAALKSAQLGQAVNGEANAPRRHTDIDIVDDTLALANGVASRVQALADCLLGHLPEGGAGSGAEEVAGGVLPRLAQSAIHTRQRLAAAVDALDRIQASLP